MNQIEQWFSILSRKRLKIADFSSKSHLAERLLAFIEEWNHKAHAFHWNAHSFDKILAQCQKKPLQQPA
jgi:transposase